VVKLRVIQSERLGLWCRD